jgi:ectoine hydroxylase-related dioxygenase (phytanoyl-CoA dioxygenase family)
MTTLDDPTSDPIAALPHHTLQYRILNNYRADPLRTVEVYASPQELAFFREQGYLVRERLFTPDQIERLRDALQEIADQEVSDGRVSVSTGAGFGGLFLRHLMDKHPAFLELFRFAPTLSVARAMLGPQVQVLPMTARISYPDQPNQQTEWHIHQRVHTDPPAPFFSFPHVLDVLLYLDDLNEANGLLSVVPGTHLHTHTDVPKNLCEDLAGQVDLRLPAGSVVMIHGNLWHRALPTTPQGSVRRMLILPYAAAWLKLPSYGERPENGLMRSLYANADTETRELLGLPEGLY